MRWASALLLCGALSAASGADLPPAVARVLSGHGIPADEASILVQAVDEGEPLLSHLPDMPRNPASVMKLVTTWAALEVLGPAYTWPTEVYFLGDFDGEILDGDLALRGFGDPSLMLEEFWGLLRALRRIGLDEIRGDLLLDDSYFQVVEDPPGDFDGQPFRAYNVLPNSLLVNLKAVRFEFLPRKGRVRITTDPPLSNLQIRNRLELSEGPCAGYQAGISFNVPNPETADEVIFEGRFPASCGAYSLTRTVLQHDTYALGLFQALWREMGGQLRGGVRRATVAEDARPVMTWHSPPLGEVIRSINKNSNNVMTRQLLYTLGAEAFEPPGTREKGAEAVRTFLAARGLDPGSLVLSNGAGLSRDGRVSAQLLADILRASHASVYAPEFIASLSLGGLDGTTRARFNGRAEAGQLHVKSGRLDHVSALAGFVRAATGKTYVIVVLLNAEDAHRGPGKELEEAVVHWVYEQQ